MSGFDQLAALLDRPADRRPNLYDAFADESECVEDMTPGAAIVAAAAIWFGEHWPAMVLGFATGLLAIAVPAFVAVQLS